MERIFERQAELMGKYHSVEQENSRIFQYQDPSVPVDLNTEEGQARLKHLAWYTVEEIGEAMAASTIVEKQVEFIDAVHFFVELCITAGLDAKFFPKVSYYYDRFRKERAQHDVKIEVAVGRLIHVLGFAMNQLKNKPWKKNHQPLNPTAKSKFYSYLYLSLLHLLEIGWTLGVSSPERLEELYMGKADENRRRQEGDY